ncbi:unconventional myosin IC isoform X3 [Nilaparvata lugens]|uniref:unconventional myosin IC isoform X3 n=1 Tax=Nilaparvata lugens TaxID=108931 RepID=UPI00193E6B53|nr:unconventional myosin IC isoform X3 [Nilaparvata lugens]
MDNVESEVDGMERSLHERDRVGVQDCVLLEDYTSEKAFVENLQRRFKENLIYTYIGQVLVSVNPYRNLPIYGEDAIAEYENTHIFEAPPHVYAITDAAYRSLLEEHREQCILISGESGSGKTEASKKVLQYIAAVSQHKGRVENVKDKLLQSNPVLEAFGNAKTNRNDNSSRFGKYMDIQFNFLGEPVGGNILNYLLEKSRVVHQSKGERNFHIFYQLLSGGNDLLLSKLLLERDLSQYTYFTDEVKGEGLSQPADSVQFREVQRAMQVMELSDGEQEEIFTIVASILHLGNVGFSEEEGIAFIPNRVPVSKVAKLLGCSESELEQALTHRTIDARGDVVTSPLNRELAVYARDALAKAVYDRLFTWLVQRLNKSLQPAHHKNNTVMGILDIYGFEIFQTNSFEQFCINYCNEKLQQVFIELTLKSEQEEYLKEGIEWEPVQYFNNKVICNLIEEKYKGIISLLDEECLRPGEPTDLSLLTKLNDQLNCHDHFTGHRKADKNVRKTMGRDQFILVHYAGEVTYNISGFIEKNNDLLFRDLREVMGTTHNSITRSVFPASSSRRRPETAATQFKASLNQLMAILMNKEPSYIRCIKPNDFKMPGQFNEEIVTHQVKYLGLMENLRVRRAGFAYRRCYAEFLQRYKCLSPATWPHHPPHLTDKHAVQLLVDHLQYGRDDYRMGNTKIFIRYAKTLFQTEDAFQARKHELVTMIQSRWRGFVQRRKYVQLRNAAIVIETWTRRMIAKRHAQRRRHAVKVIRAFIEGFITRGGEPTDINKRFIRTARVLYLERLASSLPTSLLSSKWPVPPIVCSQASHELKRLHRLWLAKKYRDNITPERKKQMELKVLAEKLFKGKKKSYPQSVGQLFVDDRLSSDVYKPIKGNFISQLQNGEKPVYFGAVYKFDRHGYKRRDRIMVVTNSALYLVSEEGKQFKQKHRLSFENILKLEITSESDNFLLLRIPPEQIEKDKGDLILEVPNLIEAITKIISVTKQTDLLNVNSITSGTISHNLSGGKQGIIDITQGMNGPTISKGKSGHLIIVG